MNKKALSLAICMAMAFPTVSKALSLGDIESNSNLNQPFRGKINLLSTSVAEAKSLRIRVAPPEIFNRVGIDRPAFLNSIRFRTTVQNGRPVILVSSNQPINEPFLNFLLEVSWPNGQLLKEYTVLLDPPVLMRPDTAIASNRAGVRAEPRRAQGRITRPVQQPRRAVRPQQPRRVVRAAPRTQRAAPRRAPVRRAPARRVAAVAPRIVNYRVRRGDTLSKVAKRLGYSGVRRDQMMMALFEKNRRAFSKRNMNNLKAGAVLKRPSLREAKAINYRSAKSQVIAQARAWKKDHATQVAKRSTPKASTQVASAPKQAHLEVIGNKKAVEGSSSQGSAANGSIQELKRQLVLANESLTTRQKENQELKSRVSELKSLLRKKNRLITMKSQQLAQLQQNLSGDAPKEAQTPEVVVNQNAEEAIANVDTPVVPNVAVNEGEDIQQQLANQLSNEQGEIVRNDQEPIAMATETPETQESPFANEAKTESTDIMGLLGSPLSMGIGGGSLLALLGGLWYMRRRRANNDDYEEFSSIEIEDELGEEPSFDEDPFDSSSAMIDESEFVTHDEVVETTIDESDDESILDVDKQEDVLQEADVYIVYGLHDQAESELKRAIDSDPLNLSYRHKLLENYKAAGDKEAFETSVNEFMSLEVDGKDKYLEDITEWGNSLIPESKLFSGDSLSAAAMGAAGAGVAMVAGTALASEDKIEDLEENLDNFDLDDVLSGADTEIESKFDDIDLNAEDDFMVEIDDMEPISNIEADMTANLDEISFDDDLDLDDDFLTNDKDDSSLDSLISSVEESTDDIEISTASLDDIEIDTIDDALDIDMSDVKVAELGSFDEMDFDAGFEDTNLSLDLDSDQMKKIIPEDSAYKSASESLDSIDDAEDNLLAEFDDNLSFLDLDDDAEAIEETQVETKLDLAKAYIDMGDIDGARSTLEEVLLDGSDEQKRLAEELLHQTG